MDNRTDNIVFLCYGYDRVFYECAFALLSLSGVYENRMPEAQICIYTDKPNWFRAFKDCPLQLNFRETDAETIKRWRGNIDFVHRVKIEVLKDFAINNTGNILYADTDVVFTRPLDTIFDNILSGKHYMHIMEGKISDGGNPIFVKLNNFLKQNASEKHNGKPLNEIAMWNAGVLGFNITDAALLDAVLEFTDTYYPKFPKHIVEQFAFSIFLSDTGIKPAAPYILHYWNLKETGDVLASFFNHFKNASWNELVRYSSLIQIPALMQEKINFYQGRSIMDKVRKKKWIPAIPDWTEMGGTL